MAKKLKIEDCDITFDWKDPPGMVMETVNNQLKKYGLKFEEVDTKSDFYAFKLIKVS